MHIFTINEEIMDHEDLTAITIESYHYENTTQNQINMTTSSYRQLKNNKTHIVSVIGQCSLLPIYCIAPFFSIQTYCQLQKKMTVEKGNIQC